MSKFQIVLDGRAFEIEMDASRGTDAGTRVRVNNETVSVRVPSHDGGASKLPEWVVIDDRPYEVSFDGDSKHLYARGQTYTLQIRDLETAPTRFVSGDERVRAPIPGVVTQVLVQPGDTVKAGQPLFILEAMKMENQIRAPRDGVLGAVNVSAGSGVVLGQLLAEIV